MLFVLISPCLPPPQEKAIPAAFSRDEDAQEGRSGAHGLVKPHWIASAESRQEGRQGHTPSDEEGCLPGSVGANAAED